MRCEKALAAERALAAVLQVPVLEADGDAFRAARAAAGDCDPALAAKAEAYGRKLTRVAACASGLKAAMKARDLEKLDGPSTPRPLLFNTREERRRRRRRRRRRLPSKKSAHLCGCDGARCSASRRSPPQRSSRMPWRSAWTRAPRRR